MTTKVLLITGGSGKLGQNLISHFLRKGDTVVFTASSTQSIEMVRENFRDINKRLFGIAQDFTQKDFAANILHQLNAQGLQPDGLVNNARSLSFLKMEDDGTVNRENFLNEYLVDVVAPYELTMALAQAPGSRLRRVVNIGSQYGTVAANPALYDDHARQSPIHYSVAKAALAHLTRELAVRLALDDIQVNCVAFGGFEGRVDEQFKERYQKLAPLGRMLRNEEVAGPVDYLLSDMSSGMTGQVVSVDGGWSIW
ncbi:SDR family oxidoreductase [Desulfuromonas acetoxidans]|uniref:SDR family NAD(P)-dependent oxidoreductase n=1 Tax=Desulfuromonas acetoxidans TaxID=891 RepID=UPI00293174D6|nr:SDR family oxidoreductase [Desulfuromonas acetoxidans]